MHICVQYGIKIMLSHLVMKPFFFGTAFHRSTDFRLHIGGFKDNNVLKITQEVLQFGPQGWSFRDGLLWDLVLTFIANGWILSTLRDFISKREWVHNTATNSKKKFCILTATVQSLINRCSVWSALHSLNIGALFLRPTGADSHILYSKNWFENATFAFFAGQVRSASLFCWENLLCAPGARNAHLLISRLLTLHL